MDRELGYEAFRPFGIERFALVLVAGTTVTTCEPTLPTLCIVNYNGAKHLARTLPAVRGMAREFAEVLLVDNASEDDSLKVARALFPEARVVRLDRNDGPGRARNVGLDLARTELVFFIDNDVIPEPGCAALLARALSEHPNAAVAAPRILYAHEPDVVQYDGADNHYLGLMILHHQNLPRARANAATRRVDGVVSAAFMVARSRLDGETFDPDFFIYVEDHDFGLRLRLIGREILSVPEALCLHGDGAEGLSIRAVGAYTARRAYLLIRNRWLLLLKNYSPRTLLVLAPALLAFEAGQLFIAAKKGWLPEWWSAFRWIVARRREILAERRRIQAKRRVPDRELLRGGPVPFRAELTTSSLEKFMRRLLDAVAIGWWRIAAPLI
ncbi:MAG: glycosyltransferase family 2 protein [Geminicoccaceae bacterium]|nr:glycosyltransferase family 2 protein [Geminicoccaceae bacterium]MCS7268471.1 glycosyltransferase family 2 protein [Geminicoccaceae bacterium]MCX7629536.1 glycosyltransferase family 2 protein [Geminicoccaceae bacterium]MDW8126015.1 glycosyltransferase family 2 protein [Geminicoccaceae bacterium]MDW8340867.1 glycosyltransferase family 2 protein [Geminicoccaceae bacterium]